MTDITTQAVERLAQRHTLNDDEAATLRALAAERDAAIAEAHATGHERAAWKDRAEKAEAQLAGARDSALVEALSACKKVAETAKEYNIPQMVMGANSCHDDISDLRIQVHAILALRDKPAPAVTVQEAANIAECAFDDRPLSRAGHHSEMDWTDGYRDGTRAAAAALRAIAGGGDE